MPTEKDEPEDPDKELGTQWVVVAGSSSYGNYRHQADVCHAYQLLKKGGLKEENIVVFTYDDIVAHPLNPRPGIIINHSQGDDVYAGVPKALEKERERVREIEREKLEKGGVGGVVLALAWVLVWMLRNCSPELFGLSGE